tara:strand:- start:583 stop:819 length:237 start_codon:yes stop_codon:yes gene_type:complete
MGAAIKSVRIAVNMTKRGRLVAPVVVSADAWDAILTTGYKVIVSVMLIGDGTTKAGEVLAVPVDGWVMKVLKVPRIWT